MIPDPKQQVIHILAETFHDNPSVLGVIKNDSKKAQRIRALAAYAYETARRRSGVFLSNDGRGMALCYVENMKKDSLIDYLEQVKLVFKAIGLSRVPAVMKKDAYVKRQRPMKEPYLYFWFLGVREGQPTRAAWELAKKIFRFSEEKELPILLETSVPRNKHIYERFGFYVYHQWPLPGRGETLWFMRRDVPKMTIDAHLKLT